MGAAVTSTARPAEVKEAAEDEPRWQTVMELPCRVTVDLSLPNFRVEDFLGLQPGSVLNTRWGVTRDLPLKVNGVLIGWGELEGTGSRLSTRVTELA